MKFIRFGTFKPQKHHKRYDEDGEPSFHSAPVKYGIYAFPSGKMDMFLLGATYDVSNSSCKSAYVKNKNGEKVKMDDVYYYTDKEIVDRYGFCSPEKKINKEVKPFIKNKKIRKRYIWDDDKNNAIYFKKPKIFEYNGLIWHHLTDYVSHVDVIKESGSWVLTDMKTYMEAFKRCDAEERFKSSFNWKDISTFKGVLSRHRNYYAVDHYEVFIEKIK